MAQERPALNELVRRITQEIYSKLDDDGPLRHNDARVYGAVQAAVAHGLYGFIEWQAKQMFAHSAEEKALLEHAWFWHGRERIPATPATGPITVAGTTGAWVTAGSVWQRLDGATYTVQTSVQLTATGAMVQVQADIAGAGGEVLAGEPMTLVSPLVGVSAEAVVGNAGIGGGSDIESIEALRAWVLEAQKARPIYGKRGDYEIWAKQVAGVTRAWQFKYSYGAVNHIVVYFVRDGDANFIPNATEVAKVQAYIDSVKMERADVQVIAPQALRIQYQVQLAPDSLEVRQAVAASLKEMTNRDATPGGVLLKSHITEAISITAGEVDHVLIYPTANITPEPNQICTFGGVTWI